MSDGTVSEGQQAAPDSGAIEAREPGAPVRRARRVKARDDRPARTARAAEETPRERLAKAMDGWGNPLQVEGPPGWDYYWVNDRDLQRYGQRPWTACRWGYDEVLINGLSGEGKDKGTPITFNELRLYKMRQEQTEAIRERDPNRIAHQLAWQRSQQVSDVGLTHAGADGKVRFAGVAAVHPNGEVGMKHQEFTI